MSAKKFSFPLEKVLKLREFEEERARIELGRAVSEVERINTELKTIAGKRCEAGIMRSQDNPGKSRETEEPEKSSGFIPARLVDMDGLFYIEKYISRLDSERDKLLEDLTAAELVVEKKREIYVEAAKNLKTMQNLKEKKQEIWHKEYLDSQAEEIDDIINSR